MSFEILKKDKEKVAPKAVIIEADLKRQGKNALPGYDNVQPDKKVA